MAPPDVVDGAARTVGKKERKKESNKKKKPQRARSTVQDSMHVGLFICCQTDPCIARYGWNNVMDLDEATTLLTMDERTISRLVDRTLTLSTFCQPCQPCPPCHLVTLSPCHPFTLSPFHLAHHIMEIHLGVGWWRFPSAISLTIIISRYIQYRRYLHPFDTLSPTPLFCVGEGATGHTPCQPPVPC
jgi:hypothetical protein